MSRGRDTLGPEAPAVECGVQKGRPRHADAELANPGAAPTRRSEGNRRRPASAPRHGSGSGDRHGRHDRAAAEFEVEVLEGLAPLARAEVERSGVAVVTERRDGLRVRAADPTALLALRLASAVYLRLAFAVPRPKALLGDEHFRRLAEGVRRVAGAQPAFRGFRFAAAGAGSTVFQRLAERLHGATGLTFDADEGELLVRVRPVPDGEGWEALLRLTPRPLSARAWRVCNRPGGLNATLAAAMNEVAGCRPSDRYLNLMCGSGTLLVERFLAGPAASLAGLDIDDDALACAAENLAAAGVRGACRLLRADVRSAPLATGGFDVIVVDLPWGDAVGSHAENARLHPAVLDAADRLGAPDVRLVVLTHELRLFQGVLRGQRRWNVTAEIQVGHGGHHPRLYLLRRS